MIEAKNLTKRYGAEALALDDVSFRVGAGEIYCLLGAAGAGKTTTIGLFLALMRPTQGHARIGGVDCTASPLSARRHAAFVTPGMSLDLSLSARRNVEFFARIAGPGIAVTRASVDNAMRAVGVAERCFDSPILELGRETRILLWLAIAMLRQTPALLLDEPTAGLDAHAASLVHECLLDFRDQGKAVLVATSEVVLATQVADRIGLLTTGRKAAERTRQEVLDQNLTQFYLEFAGRQPAALTPSAALPTRAS